MRTCMLLTILSMSFVLMACDKKITPEKSVTILEEQNKIFKRTEGGHLLDKAIIIEDIQNNWTHRIEKYFGEKGSQAYLAYRKIKAEDRAEIAALLISKKLNHQSTFQVHFKHQMKLKKEIGDDVYKGYLENLKDENLKNSKLGIDAKIYL